jgi:hypothetical protein
LPINLPLFRDSVDVSKAFLVLPMKMVAYFWASPNTLVGLLVGALGFLSGGSAQIRRGCVEFYGGILSKLLNCLPPNGARAMTLGHVIIGSDQQSLEVCRNHEQVHVRQYERWGPFFVPAYLGCSLILWLRKRDYYRMNPFEVEAFSREHE